MKKIIFGLTAIFIASQLFVSCSSESNVLSQFSKRKYLKKFKKEKVDDQNVINKYEYTASNTAENNEYEPTIEEVVINEIEEVDNTELVVVEELEEIDFSNISSKDYSEWNIYNRKIDLSSINLNDSKIKLTRNKVNSERVNDVVLVILSIFIPPLAVYLYDNSISTNFWVDLVLTLFFWLPGIIFALLVCFTGVSL